MRSIKLVVGVLVCASMATACGSGDGASGTDGEFVIGMDSNMGEPHAFASVPYAAGVKAYLNKVNEDGGVDGHKIQFELKDDRDDAATGQSNLRALDQEGASVVLGNMSSTVWASTSVLAQQLKLPQWSSGAADEAFYPPQPYLYRYVSSSQQVANAMVDFGLDQAEVSSPKVALMRYVSAGTDSWSEVLTGALKDKGIDVAAESTYQAGSTDVGVPASKVTDAQPDVVLAVLLDDEAPRVVQTLRNQGYTGPIVAWVATSEGVLQAINDPKYFALREVVVPSDPAAADMMADAKAAGVDGDMTGYYGTLGYVNAKIAVEVLKRCGYPCDGEKFEKTFEDLGDVDVGDIAGPGYGKDAGKSHLFVNSIGFWALQSGATQSSLVGDWYPAPAGN